MAEFDKNVNFSFFDSHKNPYYIHSPSYTQTSAGIRCLHYLCNAINDAGYEAYIYPAETTKPGLRVPCLAPQILKDHYLSGKYPIAVYPETVTGNPFALPIVTRWLLNTPGHLGGPKFYSPNDNIYYMEPWVVPDGFPTSGKLTTPLVDQSIFNNDNNPHDTNRKLECYYSNKYYSKGGFIPADIKQLCVSLCLDIPRSPEEIASILRNSRFLRCYEHTALVMEALMCGCPVLLMPSTYFNRKSWGANELPPGVGWADEEDVLERLKNEIPYFIQSINNQEAHYRETVVKFISDTQINARNYELTTDSGKFTEGEDLLWHIPRTDRKNRLDEFLNAYAKHFSVFNHWNQASPVLRLADWLNKSISNYDKAISHQKLSSYTPPQQPLSALDQQEENHLLDKSFKFLQNNKHEKAIPLLAKLVAHDTVRWEVYETLGQLYAEQEKLDEAASVLLRGASLEFTSTHCLRKLAAVYAMQGDLWRTLAACAQILKNEPDDAELHLFIRDVLVSTSPRFDNISWLAPEWNELIDTLGKYQSQVHSARSLLDSLANKVQEVLKEHHPLLRLGQPDADDPGSAPQSE